MYASHFGLTEGPFSLTPDPRYLYMSEPHREALAHLLYGIEAGGGFVQLTGEVGTGKTTVCRCLLEQLPAHVDVALVLNPRLTDVELLATICDELHVPYRPETASLKHLVDALYRHLLDAHGRGRRTVLVLDEAQDLNPEVLEQVRLLTNLETAREKLLQVILIGQPELTRLLNRPKLRQLAQRITARYHLSPLSRSDTAAYVRHRLRVAGREGVVFTPAALWRVHRLSRGIPRLVNAVCDRALLGAYTRNRPRVDARTVGQAAAEVRGRPEAPGRFRRLAWIPVAALVATALASAWLVASSPRSAPRPVPAAAPGLDAPSTVLARAETPARSDAPPPPPPGALAADSLGDVLADPGLDGSRGAALAALHARWRPGEPPRAAGLACEGGRLGDLACLAQTGSWTRLRRLTVPVVIELVAPSGERRYATVTALGETEVTLEVGGRSVTVPGGEVHRAWEGVFIVAWRPPEPVPAVIWPGARGAPVAWVRQRLAVFDGRAAEGPGRDVYDDDLRERVIAFQRSRALAADGLIGLTTLAQLATTLPDPAAPGFGRPDR